MDGSESPAGSGEEVCCDPSARSAGLTPGMARLMMVHMLRANNSALHGISGSYRKVASAQTPKDLEKQSMRNTITLGDGFTLRTLSLSVVQTSYGSLVGTCCSL